MQHPWSQFHPFISAATAHLPPEWVHNAALNSLRFAHRALPQARFECRRQCMGLEFVNPIGLAAGLDKDAIALPAWHKCGFGYVEIGGVTPRPQPGNPAPRLFRLSEHQVLINRMGFNSDGMVAVRERIEQYRKNYDDNSMRIGINLGKNKDTPLANAAEDYIALLESFWPLADYLCINISSPNTANLRSLGQPKMLEALLDKISLAADRLKKKTSKETPLTIKVNPDQGSAQLAEMVGVVRRYPISALIATNTTRQRPAPINSLAEATESGGLSGPPLTALALNTIKTLRPLLENTGIELIGCGGISSKADAQDFVTNGASLIQIYAGFVFQGPQLIADLVSEFANEH